MPDTITSLLQRYDRERFLATLLAPTDRQGALWALLGFNLEIARTREAVSQSILGQIRLQWWRDAMAEIYDGKPPRRHEIVQPLSLAIGRFGLSRIGTGEQPEGRV